MSQPPQGFYLCENVKIGFREFCNNKRWREIAQLLIALLKTDFDSHLAELDEFEFFCEKNLVSEDLGL